jgi:hypothetical protein
VKLIEEVLTEFQTREKLFGLLERMKENHLLKTILHNDPLEKENVG